MTGNPVARAARLVTLLVGVAAATSSCGDSAPQAAGGSGGTAGTGAAAGNGGNTGVPGRPALEPLSATPRFAVVSSDYSESSIAVLDEDFTIIDESWINSGTTYPGLVATLSGDVVLPTRQAGDGTFALLDRFFTDVVSRFFVPSGNLAGQTRTHGELSNYSSNPRDFIYVHATSAWATRYTPNLDPDAAPENAGTDLLEIDPTTMTPTGSRIDLSSLDTTAAIKAGSSTVEMTVHARPSRGVLVGSKLVVGLDRLSSRFDAAGPGMVALVDLDDASIEGLLLGKDLASCGHVTPVPRSPDEVAISCIGFARPYLDEAQTRASAAVFVLEVTEEGASVQHAWRAADHPSSAIAVEGLVALGGSRVAAVDLGDLASETPDVLYTMDLETGEQYLLHESSSAFEIGMSAYDPDADRLYVPDAGLNRVLILQMERDGATDIGSIRIAPSIGFPPRAVYRLK